MRAGGVFNWSWALPPHPFLPRDKTNHRAAFTARQTAPAPRWFEVMSFVQPGSVFMPMHDAQVNALTAPECDPHPRQPSYKYCAVHMRPV